jgi:hypothetical protein
MNKGTTHTVETRLKMSNSQTGKVAWNRGKTVGPKKASTKEKTSIALKGRAKSTEHINAAAVGRWGRPAIWTKK